jgi:O-antigen/teichoic acid export membrane protein
LIELKVYKEIASHTLIYGLGTIIPRILNYGILTPLYTYNLAESSFGTITEMYSYVAFLMVILTFGIETAFFRYSSKSDEKSKIFNHAFTILLVSSSFFLLSIIFFNSQIASIIGYSNQEYLIIVVALIVYFDVLVTLPLAKLRLEGKAIQFTIIRVSNILINIILNVFFFIICKNSNINWLANLYNENIGVGYAFISNLIATIFNFLVLLPAIVKLRFNFDKRLFKEMLWYCLPLVLVGLSGIINEVSDKLFIKYLTLPRENALKEVGIYSANYKLAILMTLFIQVFRYAAEPLFFKYSTSSEAKDIYSKVMTWFVIFCLVIFLFVTLNISIFQFFIGENYRSGLFIVPIVLIANIFLGIYYNLSIWYKLSDKTNYGAFISIIGVIITIVLNIVLIPKIGYLGGAIATIVCYFIMMVLSLLIGQKYYRIEYETKNILVYFLFALLIYYINNVFAIDNQVINIIKGNILILLFIVFIVWHKRISVSELKNSLLKRKILNNEN